MVIHVWKRRENRYSLFTLWVYASRYKFYCGQFVLLVKKKNCDTGTFNTKLETEFDRIFLIYTSSRRTHKSCNPRWWMELKTKWVSLSYLIRSVKFPLTGKCSGVIKYLHYFPTDFLTVKYFAKFFASLMVSLVATKSSHSFAFKYFSNELKYSPS